MDSHIKGKRGKNGYGAVLSANGIRAAFGDAAIVGREILRTYGASVAQPIMVRITGRIPTAFTGTSPVFSLVETNIDGTGTVTTAISDFSSGSFGVTKFITVDKIYKVTYTPATGSPTAGIGYYYIEISGFGQLPTP